MSELSERKLVYEILVERAGRWNVVDVMDNREDALALGERLRTGHAAVRVTIERFDPDTRLYSTVTLWEWQAARPKGIKGPTATRVDIAPRLHQAKAPVSKKPAAWWRRLLGMS
ncbi:hypothetical protein [Zavarzinia aquatilis]|uniref:Uncharacterized protein n=1 Tax=Zavarzinia aquatilis TaxID=2211142 RepID=A0A317EH60_9PROT|nr:hypothetical protein [Zavarzinia aquatilis]PWR25606.1 hypothetical protein DKG74_01160 [Zavarzinia aquatilis]